jgi:acyl-coenzyme A synthetase/AMP-(fatty) acid ligase
MLRVLNLRLHYVRLSSTATISNSVQKTNFQTIQQLIDEDINKGNPVPVFKRALIHRKATALKDVNGEFTYTDLLSSSKKLSTQISEICGTASRITYLCPNDVTSIISQWATWISGNTAVPLSVSHPPELLKYFIKDSQSNLIITTP